MSGCVLPHQYALESGALVTKGDTHVTPTNNRAELLAIIYALLTLRHGLARDAEIFSDSEICVNLVNQSYPPRKKGELKNPDLLGVAISLMDKTTTKLQHVRGHRSISQATDPADAAVIRGNIEADNLSRQAIDLARLNISGALAEFLLPKFDS